MTTDDLGLFMATMVGHSTSVSCERAQQLLHDHYGVQGSVTRLTGERDENFKISASNGDTFVFKVANAAEDPLVTELPIAAMLHVERTNPVLPCPRVLRSLQERTSVQFTDETGQLRTARLVTYLPGKLLQSATRCAAQRAACGRLLAGMGQALRGFEHPASHRTLAWDLRNIPLLRALLRDVPAMPQADFIAEFIGQFETRVAPRYAAVRHQFIHNDFNDGNILVDSADEARVVGVIDFGDAVHTALVADVAIAAVAQITDHDTYQEAVVDLVRAYHGIEPLHAAELDILHWLIAGRVVTGVLIRCWHRAKNPSSTHYATLGEDRIRSRIELARRMMSTPVTLA